MQIIGLIGGCSIIFILYFQMRFTSRVIAEPSPQLQKELQCYFDHEVKLLSREPSTPLGCRQLMRHILESNHQKGKAMKCIIAYKFQLEMAALRKLIMEEEQEMRWTVKIFEYDPKIKKIVLRQALNTDEDEEKSQKCVDWQKVHGEESSLIVDLQREEQLIRVYFLPFSRAKKEEETQLTRAIHENFKLIRIIKEYVSFECSCDTPLVFEEEIFNNLGGFLYLKAIKDIEVYIWLEESMFDHKILKQVGEIKLPEPWLQKEQYRAKKRQIYELKEQEHNLLSTFKKQKHEFTQNIGIVQTMAGLTVQGYDDINIETFKKIKHEGLVEKTNEIKDLEGVLANLQSRLTSLEERKQEYLTKRTANQKRQVSQILEMKKQISGIQCQQQVGLRADLSHGIIYNRTRKSTDNRMIKTIFSNVDKKAKRMNETLDFNRYTINRESEQKSEAVDPKPSRKTEYKNNEKKVASVVKEIDPNIQINPRQLREDYENQILKIDFEMEKRYVELLAKYQKGCESLLAAIEENDELNI